ncbi:MAG: YhcG family protein [Saprospiraceae bacterium]
MKDQIAYQNFFAEVKERIRKAQYEALRAVNKELVGLYWDLGKMIVEKQAALGWGKSVVQQLAEDLQKTFPGMNGLSSTNLWYMRQFYTEYFDKSNLQPLVGEIGWTHNLMIFTKCKEDFERQFYLLHVRKFGWTKDVLIHHIENKTYEKYLLNQTNFDQTLPDAYKDQAKLAVKDHYTFDFLELTDEHSERELELALVNQIRAFLIEMGAHFAFLGHQYCLKVEDEVYFIDLLLYHRQLQCMIAIELKIGDFKPEYKGKMEFYLTALNLQVKLPHENNAIGIIICKNKKRTIVEYSLANASQPIGVATYSTSNILPERYQSLLPSAGVIAERLAKINDLLKHEVDNE